MYGYLVDNLNREYPRDTLRMHLKKHTDQSWLIALDGPDQKPVTDELIGIGDRESSFDVTLNLMVLFFEIVAECYQNIYPE